MSGFPGSDWIQCYAFCPVRAIRLRELNVRFRPEAVIQLGPNTYILNVCKKPVIQNLT